MAKQWAMRGGLMGLALVFGACATSSSSSHHSHSHASRPVRSSGRSHASSSGHSSHGHRGGGSSSDWAGSCLGALCDASVCALDAAADDSDGPAYVGPERAPNGDSYVDPPDPIIEAATTTPAPAPPEATPASADPSGEAGPPPTELAEAIALAQRELAGDERAAFVARFVATEDQAAIDRGAPRDLVSELAGAPGAALRARLTACHTWGVHLQGPDLPVCGGPAPALRWRMDPAKGWVIDGLPALIAADLANPGPTP